MRNIKLYEGFLNEGLEKTAIVTAEVNFQKDEIFLVSYNEESIEVPQEKTPKKTRAAILRAAKELGAKQVLLK
jgi:hypothetical protein